MSPLSASPRQLPRGYVEQIRFSWERELERRLEPYVDDRHEAPSAYIPASVVRLTESNASRVVALAREVATTLRCEGPFELFQTRNFECTNAQALLSRQPFAVRLIGPLVSLYDDSALKATIGHELGHYMAHGTLADPPSKLLRFTGIPTDNPIHLICSVAMELTADRFGLLACQDLSAMVRLEVASATGVNTDSLGLDAPEHLRETCSAVERGEAPFTDGTHPSAEFRLYAAWLFSRTDAYHQLTGGGPADLTLSEVDARMASMLWTPVLEEVLSSLPPPPGRSRITAHVGREVRPVSPEPRPKAKTEVADAAAKIVAGVRAIAGRLKSPRKSDEAVQGPIESEEIDMPDELELRFRKLEAAAASEDREVPEELERRFRELEEREE